MERPQPASPISVVTDTETKSKKRSRAETDSSSPTEPPEDATLPPLLSTKTTAAAAEPRPATAGQASLASVQTPGDSRSTSLEPPSSVAGRSVSAFDSTSTFSIPDSTFSESFSPSASQPSIYTAPRGSLSPPYMFAGSPRPPDSAGGPADDGEEGTDLDELEEQAAVLQAEGGSIVVDSDDLATDDGYGTDNNTTASTSLAESVRDYIYENGRRYHRFREGRYNFPNDDVECVYPLAASMHASEPAVAEYCINIVADNNART